MKITWILNLDLVIIFNKCAYQFPDVIQVLERSYILRDAKNLDPGWLDPHPENSIKEESDLQNVRGRLCLLKKGVYKT